VADPQTIVISTIQVLLERKDLTHEVKLESDLYEELELDSLDIAELSAVLEEELGHDPYSEGISPGTVGELIEYYAA
jgi:acyl carrier protein